MTVRSVVVLLASLLTTTLLMVPVGARAEGAPAKGITSEAASSIQKAIVEQIDAFKRDDADAAFDIAAPSIQQRFVTAGNFIDMVRSAYPSVFRAQKLMFLKLVNGGDGFHQSVLIAGPDGELVQGIYSVIELDGAWRITGCVLVKRPGNAT